MSSIIDVILDFILNPWFIISLIFWIFVVIMVYLLRNRKDSYNLFFPLLALFKTKRLNNFIRRVSAKNPKFWRIFWNIGIFISFGLMIYAFYFFFTNLLSLIFAPSIEQAIIPLIPGVTVDLPTLFYFILPLLFVVTTHELAHGISASLDGVEIKSTGVLGVGLFFLVGFGAFVEVNEWELNSSKHHRNTRFRIAAAGTYINAITAALAFILLISFPYLVSPFYKQVTQIYYVFSPEEGGFNYGALEYGDSIDAIKKQNESDIDYLYLDELYGISLGTILNNETRIGCSVGDNLTFKIYNPFHDEYSEKSILVGPKYSIIKESEKDQYLETLYNLSLRFEKASDTSIRLTYNYSSRENLNILITKVNGTSINYSKGDTLEYLLTNFNLKYLNLTSDLGLNYLINVQVIDVFIGVQSTLYWMHKNDFAKFFTGNWPDFWLREIAWLFIIAFSLFLFNIVPLPVFDGDRMLKELIDWIFGNQFSGVTKKRKDRFIYKGKDTDCNLSEYRVEKVDNIKVHLKDKSDKQRNGEIILGENNYELKDKTGDGFNDTVSIKLPEDSKIKENTVFEIYYEYSYDEKKKIKKTILNSIRYVTLIIVLGNFILSFVKFGFNLFWI
ncbi:MAG: site-2 protease family protein [Candidatus Thorarchaeota archaeon]